MRRVAAPSLALALLACRGEAPARDRTSPSPPSVPSSAAPAAAPATGTLQNGRLTGLRPESEISPFLVGRAGDDDVVVLVGTREEPQRFRPQVALFRLSEALGFDVVPETVLRREKLSTLLGACEDLGCAFLREHASTAPDGTVTMAVTKKPAGARSVGTIGSVEVAAWAALAARTDLSPEEETLRNDWIALLILDHVSANLFRRSVDVDAKGRIRPTSSRSAFTEHPDPEAVDALFGRLRKVKSFPKGLGDRLARVRREDLDRALSAGEYEDRLVHARCVGESFLRLRQVTGLVWAVEGR